MKTICLTFFLLIISTSFASHSFRPMIYIYESGTLTVQHSKADTKAFVKGFFEGIGATHVFSEIQSCLVDSEQVFLDIGIGITDIQTKNPEKVKEGIQRIGQAVNIIPNAALLCQAADKDVQKIVKIINTFTHPVSLIFRAEKSLLINRVEVFKEIMHVIDAYQRNDYEDLGYWTGKAMVTIFLKSPASQRDVQSNIHDLVDNFFEGAGKALVFDQLIEDPFSFLLNTGKNMLAHQEKIMLRANNVVDAYNDEDFGQLGYWIGRTVSAILMDQDEERRQEDLKALEHIDS